MLSNFDSLLKINLHEVIIHACMSLSVIGERACYTYCIYLQKGVISSDWF